MGKIEKHGTRNLRRFSFSFSCFLSFSFLLALSRYTWFSEHFLCKFQFTNCQWLWSFVLCAVHHVLKSLYYIHSFILRLCWCFFSLLLCVFLPSHPRAPVCFYFFLNLCTIRNATTYIGNGVCVCVCQFEPRSASILRHHFLMDFLWLFCYKCNQVSCTSECH